MTYPLKALAVFLSVMVLGCSAGEVPEVEVSQFSSQGKCADACFAVCYLEMNHFVYHYVPLAADVCVAGCMDKSKCTDLPIDPKDLRKAIWSS